VAELRLRCAFQAVTDAKDWDEPDIVMEQARKVMGAGPKESEEPPRQER
jgi:hypothetical protein